MSGEDKDQFYSHGFSFHDEELLSSIFSQQQRPGGGSDLGFNPASPFMMGLSECLTGGGDGTAPVVAPVTPNFSMSSSSTEVGGEEDSDLLMKEQQMEEEKEEAKGSEEAPPAKDDLKKETKPRKKGEKRQKEPRFAFVCKSEVDNLEDGYRWRKYGQKAVKNSLYPRSYYRCTTQKCNVKKRVERSHQDPSTVITTYEGQHNHYSPASIRAGVGPHLFSPPSPAMAMPGNIYNHGTGGAFQLLHQVISSSTSPPAGNPSLYNLPGGLLPPLPLPAQQPLQLPAAVNFSLLQDVLPSFSHGGQQ